MRPHRTLREVELREGMHFEKCKYVRACKNECAWLLARIHAWKHVCMNDWMMERIVTRVESLLLKI